MKRFIWNTYLDSLDKKYNLFYINRMYKDKSFKDQNEYAQIQAKLSTEIDVLSNEILNSIKGVVNETFPEIEVLLYDSRVFSRNDSFIGVILTRGLHSQTETLDVKACFEKFTGVKIRVDRIEDLNNEDTKNIEKVLKELGGEKGLD